MALACFMAATMAQAEWSFSRGLTPNAFIQTNNMTLELQCDRIRFAPAGYEDSQDIVEKQGLSFRFLKNGSTEAGAFQVGSTNSEVAIVDNYPVEIRFLDPGDYRFILDQLASNAGVNLSMVDQEVTYGIFDLKGSGVAIKKLKSACFTSGQAAPTQMEAPEGVVYCGGGGIKRQIEYVIMNNSSNEWDAMVTVNGETTRAKTAYSYFGSNQKTPKGFVVALLGEDRSEFLVFRDGNRDWIEFGDYQYDKCN
jgi:hypothetical protein